MPTLARGETVLAALIFCSIALAGCTSREARFTSHMQRGERYLTAGNYQKAEVEFRNAMQIAPGRADARLMSGRVAEKLGNLQDALALYESAIDADPANLAARTSLGRLYVFENAPLRALDVIRPALVRYPDDPGLLAVRGGASAELKDDAAGLADAERAVALAPQDEDTVSLLAALYKRIGNVQRAVDCVRAALAHRPGSIALHAILADLYATLGKDDLAEVELTRIVAMKPKDLELRYQLASFYERSKRYDDAERVLRQALTVRPESDGPKLAYVEFLAASRSTQEAESVLAEFVARSPQDFDLQLAQGAFLQQHDPDSANRVYRGIISHAGELPQGISARDRIAATLISHRAFDEAGVLVAQVLDKSPREDDALILRANIEVERGEPAAAVTDLRSVVRDRPRSPAVLRALARAYLADHQIVLAEESLRNAMEVAPGDVSVRLDLAQLLARTKRIDASIELLERTIQELPANSMAREALVRAYLAKPDLDAARRAAAQLQTAFPGDWHGPYLAGLVARAQKQPMSAELDFAQALKLQPDAVEALTAISQLDVQGGRAARAVARVQSAVAATPASAALRNLLGELYAATKDSGAPDNMARAMDEWKHCTRLEPAWWLPYHHLGWAELTSGNAQGAILTFEQGVAATHWETALATDLATVYERQGRIDDAIATYETLHREFPGLALASNNLAMLLVTYRKDRASLDRARDLTSSFADSDNPDFLDTAGWVRLAGGDTAGALQTLEDAARREPHSRVIAYHLGMAQLASGQRASARASLETALAGSARFTGWEDARSALARLVARQ